MTEQDQIKALAELDGFNIWHQPQTDTYGCSRDNHHVTSCFEDSVLASLPNYLTSYDAIIPIAVRIVGTIVITPETTPASVSELVLRKSALSTAKQLLEKKA